MSIVKNINFAVNNIKNLCNNLFNNSANIPNNMTDQYIDLNKEYKEYNDYVIANLNKSLNINHVTISNNPLDSFNNLSPNYDYFDIFDFDFKEKQIIFLFNITDFCSFQLNIPISNKIHKNEFIIFLKNIQININSLYNYDNQYIEYNSITQILIFHISHREKNIIYQEKIFNPNSYFTKLIFFLETI